MDSGRIVILNGTSSSGKTSIATEFRDRRAEALDFWFLTGIDDVLSKLPLPWLDLGYAAGPGALRSEGLGLVATDEGHRVHVGPLCRELLRTYQFTVAHAARSGLNVIVDDVVLNRTMWDDWQVALHGLPVSWIAVRCERDVVEARELARGDRPIGMAAAQFDTVHAFARYAHEIDTSILGPVEAALSLLRFLGY